MTRRTGRTRGISQPTALVTGAAGAVGREVVRALVARGYRVLATDLDYSRLESIASDENWRADGTETRRLDVRSPEAWEGAFDAVLEHWGRLDVSIHAAAVRGAHAAHETRYEDIARTFDVNVKGAILGTSLAVKAMVEQGYGHIVHIATICDLGSHPGIALFGASQDAVRAYSIAVGQELRDRGIFVTAVCPTLDFSLEDSLVRTVEVEELTRAILERALVERPLELVVELPFRFQGAIAKIGHAFPDFGAKIRRRVGQKPPARAGHGSMRE